MTTGNHKIFHEAQRHMEVMEEFISDFTVVQPEGACKESRKKIIRKVFPVLKCPKPASFLSSKHSGSVPFYYTSVRPLSGLITRINQEESLIGGPIFLSIGPGQEASTAHFW